MLKKILIVAPILPCQSMLASIKERLEGIFPQAKFTILDSIEKLVNNDLGFFIAFWQKKIAELVNTHDALVGFSFGGVLIQKSLPVIDESIKKPIILFSTPSFADAALKEKLGKVIELAEKQNFNTAYKLLLHQVYHPFINKLELAAISDQNTACQRLAAGLRSILVIDSRIELSESKVYKLNLFGEDSFLVNKKNIVIPKSGRVIAVPDAGMLVTKDNYLFCQSAIENYLYELNEKKRHNSFAG